MEKHVLKLNNEAMNCLKNQMPDAAFSSLSKAESLLKAEGLPHSDRLWGITQNNLGCYHKKIGKQVMALHYFESAMQMEINSVTDAVNMSGIYLNICSIRSQLSDHISAIEFAHKSLELLNPYIKDDPSVVNSLALTYHNLAVEYHILGRNSEAIKYAQQGLSLALMHFDDHPIVELLREDLFKFTRSGKKHFVPSVNKGNSTPSRSFVLTSSVNSAKNHRTNDSQLNKDIYRVIPFVRKGLPLKRRFTPQRQYFRKDVELAEKRAEEALKELKALKKEKYMLAKKSGSSKRKVIPAIESYNIYPEIQRNNKTKSDKDKKSYKPHEFTGNMHSNKKRSPDKDSQAREKKASPRNNFLKDSENKSRRAKEQRAKEDTVLPKISKNFRNKNKAARVDRDFAKKNSLQYRNPDSNFGTMSYDNEDIYVKSKPNEINTKIEKPSSEYGRVNNRFGDEYLYSDDNSGNNSETSNNKTNSGRRHKIIGKVSLKGEDETGFPFNRKTEKTESFKNKHNFNLYKNSEFADIPKNKHSDTMDAKSEKSKDIAIPKLESKNEISNKPRNNINKTNKVPILPEKTEIDELHKTYTIPEKPKNQRHPESTKKNEIIDKPVKLVKKRDLHEYSVDKEPLSPASKMSLKKFSNSAIPAWIHGAIWRKWRSDIRRSAVRLQSWTRSHQISRLYRKIRNAVVFIQNIYRDHRSQKMGNLPQ